MAKYDANGNQIGKGKGKTYGNEQNSRLKARRAKLSASQGDPFDWRTVPADKLLHTIALLATLGGALRIGATRDGGALAVGYYLDGDTWTEYVRPQEDCDAYFENAIADLLGECEARGVDV